MGEKKHDTAMNCFTYFDSQKPWCKIGHIMMIHSVHEATTSSSMKNINTNCSNEYTSTLSSIQTAQRTHASFLIFWKLVWDHMHAM